MPGTTAFPGALDTFPDIGPNTSEDDGGAEHDVVHNNEAAAIAALQAKVGIDASVDTDSLDYKVAQRIPLSQKGAASGVATLDGAGKVPNAQLPALAITEVFTVASQAAQLALTAEEGDAAVRTDESKTYIHNGGTAGTMADWTELLAPTSAGSQSPLQFDDEGSNLGASGTVDEVDFTGAGVTASRTGNKVTVTIPGGGGGGADIHYRRDDLQMQPGQYKFALNAAPYESAAKVYKDGLLLLASAYSIASTTLTLVTAATTAVTNYTVEYWTATSSPTATTVIAEDVYFSSVVALLHANGTNASTTFTDVKGKTWTAQGNMQISTAQSKFGGASALSDGSGDWISTPTHADFDPGTGAATYELWVRPTNFTAINGLFGKRSDNSVTSGVNAMISTAGKISVFIGASGNGSWQVNFTTSGGPTAGAWNHIAVTITAAGVVNVFINGVKDSVSGTRSSTVGTNANNMVIGALAADGAFPLLGYWDDARITKGVARYTETFSPPTAAFDDA